MKFDMLKYTWAG